jgi:Ca-activated chloride channel homolog
MKSCFRKNFDKLWFLMAVLAVSSVFSLAQSGAARRPTIEGAKILNVVASREKDENVPLQLQNFALYENGIQQEIKGFSLDPSPSKIVLLVDNSQTIRADVTKLQNIVKEFAYEIFEGDQLYVVAYDEKPEIIQDWTDDAAKIEKSLGTFRKQGNPNLFDALGSVLNEVLLPIMPAARKTAVVLISDGLDRGSKRKFDNILSELQLANVTVYSLQLPDRTGGAYRGVDKPKPEQVVEKLTEGTGGTIFDMTETDPQTAAKSICDELRKNRYVLSYLPSNASAYEAKRVFLIADKGISARTKTAQPPSIK